MCFGLSRTLSVLAGSEWPPSYNESCKVHPHLGCVKSLQAPARGVAACTSMQRCRASQLPAMLQSTCTLYVHSRIPHCEDTTRVCRQATPCGRYHGRQPARREEASLSTLRTEAYEPSHLCTMLVWCREIRGASTGVWMRCVLTRKAPQPRARCSCR